MQLDINFLDAANILFLLEEQIEKIKDGSSSDFSGSRKATFEKVINQINQSIEEFDNRNAKLRAEILEENISAILEVTDIDEDKLIEEESYEYFSHAYNRLSKYAKNNDLEISPIIEKGEVIGYRTFCTIQHRIEMKIKKFKK
jgi:hypothetical protein